MGEIEVVKASKSTRRQHVSYQVLPGSRASFPSAFILEDSQKLAKRAVLSVRRGPIRYRRNSTIVCEGDPADYVFMVVDGVVRVARLSKTARAPLWLSIRLGSSLGGPTN